MTASARMAWMLRSNGRSAGVVTAGSTVSVEVSGAAPERLLVMRAGGWRS